MFYAAANMIFFIIFPFGQKEDMPMAMTIQMKVETNIESRIWAIKMAKHVMGINKQLQSQLLGLIQRRLSCTNKITFQKTSRNKTQISESCTGGGKP